MTIVDGVAVSGVAVAVPPTPGNSPIQADMRKLPNNLVFIKGAA